MGDTKHNGSSAPEIGGGNTKTPGRTAEGTDKTLELTGTGGHGDNEDVSDTDIERHRGGHREERGTEQRLILKAEQTGSEMGSETQGCGESSGTATDVADTDNTGDRTPKHETNEDRQKINERREGQSQFKSSRYSKNVENSRRTLRQGTELREKNEDEIRKEDANQHQRSGSPSESDVANTQGERTRENHEGLRAGTSRISGGQETTMANTNGGRSHEQNNEIQTGRNIPISSSEDVADTSFQGLEGSINEKLSTTKRSQDVANTNSEGLQGLRTEHELRNSKEEESTSGNSWWLVEPNVGRVAHGVSGRVHRLKALGNSIVPKIAEEIGNAIIEAERAESN